MEHIITPSECLTEDENKRFHDSLYSDGCDELDPVVFGPGHLKPSEYPWHPDPDHPDERRQWQDRGTAA